MNYNYLFSMFGSIMIGAMLVVLGGLIAEFARANMFHDTHNRAVVKAKKLDENNDGFISLDELTSPKTGQSQKLKHEEHHQVYAAEFNARLEAMFNRMDRNSDGMLDGFEISRLKHHHAQEHDSRELH